MSYSYAKEREEIFTDEGQRLFLQIRDRAHELIRNSGAATLGAIISESTGDSFQMLACVDRMVELGELVCVHNAGAKQDSVYTRGRST